MHFYDAPVAHSLHNFSYIESRPDINKSIKHFCLRLLWEKKSGFLAVDAHMIVSQRG